MVEKAATLFDEGEKCGAEANLAKLLGGGSLLGGGQRPRCRLSGATAWTPSTT